MSNKKEKYRFVVVDEKGVKYWVDPEFVKQRLLGICNLNGNLELFKQNTNNDLTQLKKIIHPIIVDYYKKELLDSLRLRKELKRKQFRIHWLTYGLSGYHTFYLEKREAFDILVLEGKILEGSHGWYRHNPNIIYKGE